MISLAVNPGFLLLAAALLAPAAPRALRGPLAVLAAAAAIAAPFLTDFGDYARYVPLGVELVPLRLDPLSQVFGLGVGLATMALAIAGLERASLLETCAILALAGGASGAIYAGDLISFTAFLECASLAICAVVFSAGGAPARGASVLVLGWQAFGGACLAVGAGLLRGESGDLGLNDRLVADPGGALLLAGLLIKVGAAPLAHVWLREALRHASARGVAAVAGLGLIAPLYGLARAFPGEPALALLGAAMAILPLPLAALEQDPRRLAAYGLASLAGLTALSAGLGGALGQGAAAASAFALCLGGALLGLSLERGRGVLGAGLAVVGAASLFGAPGTLGYAAAALQIEAALRGASAPVWLALLGGLAGTVLHVGVRFWVLSGPGDQEQPQVAFATTLANSLLAFFILVIGVNPGWLFALLPPGAALPDLFRPDRLLGQAQVLAGAAAGLAVLQQLRLYPRLRPVQAADLPDLILLISKAANRSFAPVAGEMHRRVTRSAAQVSHAFAIGSRLQAVFVLLEKRELGGPLLALVLAAALAVGFSIL